MTKAIRILLVDDNEFFRKPLAEALRRAGYVVETAAEGASALRLFQQSAFDLVVTDLIMPGKEGIETILELRRLQPCLRIIAISGGGMLDSSVPLAIAKQLGGVKSLAKPFTIFQILEAITDQLETGPAPATALTTETSLAGA